MPRKAVITVGLGFGDEGKGSCVDSLCRRLRADLVIRYSGGSQCGHNVQTSAGKRHTFSQFGAGTLAGVPTYLGQQVVLWGGALQREADALRADHGIIEPYAMLTAHPDCLVTTEFHRQLNRLKETARGVLRHGSCGHGIGEARSYWLKYGDDAVFLADVVEARSVLGRKLELMRQRLAQEAQEFLREQMSLDASFRVRDITTQEALDVEPLRQINLRYRPFHLSDEAVVVFEGAQGVLLDEWAGFHPYTTWSTVTPQHALELAAEMGCKNEDVFVLGVTRSYLTRHGAGPFPTDDPLLTRDLPDLGNSYNSWQGELRCGHLDLQLLRYAADACGRLDGVVINHLDQMRVGSVCAAYGGVSPLSYDATRGLYGMERLGAKLIRDCRSQLEHNVDIVRRVQKTLNKPIIMAGYGPTHEHRVMRDLEFEQEWRNDRKAT